MRLTRRRLLLGTVPAALIAAACGRGDAETGVTIEGRAPTVTPSQQPAPGSTPPTSSGGGGNAVAISNVDPADLHGFAFPVASACLPDSDALMPNAPRTYRAGVHEGIDFYDGLSCASIQKETPVLAMYEGRVVRADRDYTELTAAQLRVVQERVARMGYSDEQALDTYRGRQVWIDHGRGIVTRYAHLASIADGIAVGARVERGQHLGGVGESGTPESVTDPGSEIHPHVEVRVGEGFLGKGLPPAEVRALYQRLFTPAP